MGVLINFSLNRYDNSFWWTAYHYGPGNNKTAAGKKARTDYANQANAIYNGNKGFWNCYSKGVIYTYNFSQLTPLVKKD